MDIRSVNTAWAEFDSRQETIKDMRRASTLRIAGDLAEIAKDTGASLAELIYTRFCMDQEALDILSPAE